ncbi:MAG: hypothetical protein AAB967_01540, partial [Patescibacteria group bacterium]
KGFETLTGDAGRAVACPLPPSPSYRILVKADTLLLLPNRAEASLSSFVKGDIVNVYGFYGGDGVIRALTLRRVSEPIPKKSVQINNAEIVGIVNSGDAGNPLPAFIVAHRPEATCTVFRAEQKTKLPCPPGLSSLSESSRGRGIAIPESVKAGFDFMRKYEVRLSAKTVLLGRTRAALDMDDFLTGDTVNIYGSYADEDAKFISAEMVRNLVKPKIAPRAEHYDGIVVRFNDSDNSFTIRTRDDKILTVESPLYADSFVSVKGTLDEKTNIISGVSEIISKKKTDQSAIPVILELNPGIGAIGSRITIRGSGFTPTGNTVKFDEGTIGPSLPSNGASLSFAVRKTLGWLPCLDATP